MTTDNPASGEHPPIGSSQQGIGVSPADLPAVSHPHSFRFRVVLAALVGIAVGALAIAVVVVARHSGGGTAAAGGAAWSSWAPDSSGSTGVSAIAEHLAPYYRVSASQQLDVITPIAVSQATAAGTTNGSGLTVAVNTGSSGKSQSLALLNGRTVAYNICGLGAKACELAGSASTSRMLLLRREALELALYTFRYITDSQNVVVVLPPAHAVSSGSSSGGSGAPVTVAVAFVRAELAPWLQEPLSKTLQQYPPDIAGLTAWSQTEEAGLVDQMTAHALYSSQLQSQQVGGTLLVLTQLPAQ